MNGNRSRELFEALKQRSTRLWKRVIQWLNTTRDPVDLAATIRAKVVAVSRQPRTYAVWAFAGAVVLVVLVVLLARLLRLLRWYSDERTINGAVVYPHASLANPLVAGIGAALLIVAAIWQARTATKQATIAAERHREQTDADRKSRTTESFAKAVEQLGSGKLEVRLGGIYSLERISKDSPDDYWTVMENLTAFVREHSRRNEDKRLAPRVPQAPDLDELGEPPEADIAAVLKVINARQGLDLERRDWLRLDLTGAVLRQADLKQAYLDRAILRRAHLEGADLRHAHLEDADLTGAYLKTKADLRDARLNRAYLVGTHLEGNQLLVGADFKLATLALAHLEGADLRGAKNLRAEQLALTIGNAATRVPAEQRPAQWPPTEDPSDTAA